MRLRVLYADGDFRETHYTLWRGLPSRGIVSLSVEDSEGHTWQAIENWEHLLVQERDGGVRLVGFRLDSDGIPYGWTEWMVGPRRAICDAPTDPVAVDLADCLHRQSGTPGHASTLGRIYKLVGNIPAIWWPRRRRRMGM